MKREYFLTLTDYCFTFGDLTHNELEALITLCDIAGIKFKASCQMTGNWLKLFRKKKKHSTK